LTPGEQYEMLRRLERLNNKINVVLLSAAELLQALENVRSEVKELETSPARQ